MLDFFLQLISTYKLDTEYFDKNNIHSETLDPKFKEDLIVNDFEYFNKNDFHNLKNNLKILLNVLDLLEDNRQEEAARYVEIEI